MIVADANLLAYLLIPGPMIRYAEYIRSRDRVWVAPPILRFELLNVISKYHRRGDFDLDEANRLFRQGMDLVEVSVLDPDSLSLLRISKDSGCSIYDSHYVWLAIDLDVPLVTSDRQVIKAFPAVAVDVTHFA